jgi:hypothetical protein
MEIHVKLNHRAVITAIWDIGKHQEMARGVHIGLIKYAYICYFTTYLTTSLPVGKALPLYYKLRALKRLGQ